MIKIAAEIATSVQQRPKGTELNTGASSAGAMLTGAVGGRTGVAVTVTNGWVLRMVAGLGESDNPPMRAVSFLGTASAAAGGTAAIAGVAGAGGSGEGVLISGGGGGTMRAGAEEAASALGGGGGGGGTIRREGRID